MAVTSVLVVEDNELNLELVREILLSAGFVVYEARSSDAGLHAASTLSPHLILLDIRLPGLDGFGVLKRLRADPVTAGIPVVALTAQAMVGDREQVLAAGFDGYIAKPVDTRTLADQVRSVLEQSPRGRAAGGEHS